MSKIVRIDGIKWWFTGTRSLTPICPDHDLRMRPVAPRVRSSLGGFMDGSTEKATQLKCAEGPHYISMQRSYKDEKDYVLDRIDAKVFKNMQVLNLDDEAVPIVKSKIKTKDEKYFVTSQLMQSKRGLQLVIYAGEKGKNLDKSQIFVEPAVKRLDFDRKNIHPNDIFLEVKAIFQDGSSHTLKGKPKEKK